jgi:hypothetical protein
VACSDAAVPMPPGPWVAACPSCRVEFRRHGKPRIAWHCRGCGQERGALTWAKAASGETR